MGASVSTVSVVIPTFNRGDKLASVLDCLLASDHERIEEIGLIVVDDGLRVPARLPVSSRNVSSPLTPACCYQENTVRLRHGTEATAIIGEGELNSHQGERFDMGCITVSDAARTGKV